MKNELIKEFVGIDVSKLTLDVHLHEKNLHCVFNNDSKGHLSMFSWIRKHCKKNEELRFCFEHTGIYSLELAVFLKKHDQVIYIVSGLAIKRSMGLKRGKSDIYFKIIMRSSQQNLHQMQFKNFKYTCHSEII
jgi:transposase